MDLRLLFEAPSTVGLETQQIGCLSIETGELFCCDPFALNGPIKHGFAPGRYPVTLWFREEPGFGRRVAFAAVTFFPGVPGGFFEATYRVGGASSSGVDVQSGLASFIDGKTALAFSASVNRHNAEKHERSFYEVHLAAEFAKSAARPGVAGSWAIYSPNPNEPGVVVMFASGRGGGSYRVFWGDSADPSDPDAPLTCLIADFGVCDDLSDADA